MSGPRRWVRDVQRGMADDPGPNALFIIGVVLWVVIIVTVITVGAWPYGLPVLLVLLTAWWLLRAWLQKGSES